MSLNEHKPRIREIIRVIEETETIKTIYFRDKLISENITPGQFVMIWLPKVDEIPMGISHIGEDGVVSITVEKVGEATSKLANSKPGDLIGVRGPYGRGFSPIGENNLIIGGGSGMAPLVPLVENAVKIRKKIKVILGGKNSFKLPFIKFFNDVIKIEKYLTVTTEDGSYGIKGLVTDVLKEIIEDEKYDRIYACGPELMLKAIYEFCLKHNLPLEVSLERYFKCGIGLCGSCCIGEYRVCIEGPVFNINELKKIENIFGNYTRDAAGVKKRLEK
ncbi:MAG: dihydroorotate dehydrogenase electron transfer subunit [Candidatus Odinarchaeia archaeon]